MNWPASNSSPVAKSPPESTGLRLPPLTRSASEGELATRRVSKGFQPAAVLPNNQNVKELTPPWPSCGSAAGTGTIVHIQLAPGKYLLNNFYKISRNPLCQSCSQFPRLVPVRPAVYGGLNASAESAPGFTRSPTHSDTDSCSRRAHSSTCLATSSSRLMTSLVIRFTMREATCKLMLPPFRRINFNNLHRLERKRSQSRVHFR
jgi:hypothetical protein